MSRSVPYRPAWPSVSASATAYRWYDDGFSAGVGVRPVSSAVVK